MVADQGSRRADVIGTSERFQPSAMGRRSSRKKMLTYLCGYFDRFDVSRYFDYVDGKSGEEEHR